MLYAIAMHFTAPVCYNTTSCEGETVSDNLMSFHHCCSKLSGVSYASSGQCFLCQRTGILAKPLLTAMKPCLCQ